MSEAVEALILDLLEWLEPAPRPYADVMAAWRTSCPQLAVWEEANARGFIARQRATERSEVVTVSASGRAHLRQHRSVPVR